MSIFHPRIAVTVLAIALLAACNRTAPPVDPATGPDAGAQTMLGRSVERAMAKAREELATSNISLNDDIQIRHGSIRIGENTGRDSLPKAEITPQGELLIEGQAVPVDQAQRQLLLDYRGHIIALADIGMALGVRGADLGMKAAGEALRGIFSGKPEQIEKRIEAEADVIKTQAQDLCRALQPMLHTQQALAESLPAFRPYARLTQDDVASCMKHGEGEDEGASATDGTSQAQVQSQIRDGIRQAIRDTVGVAATASSVAGASGNVATVDGIRFLLPPGSQEVENDNGRIRIRHRDGLRVHLQGERFEVNGERYPAPARGSEVDLRHGGSVRIDGNEVRVLQD